MRVTNDGTMQRRLCSGMRNAAGFVAIDTFSPEVFTSAAIGGGQIGRRKRRGSVNTQGRILVLEKDPLIRPLLERWLRDAGWQLVGEAIAAHETLSLVIADVPDPRAAAALLAQLQVYSAPILLLSARFRRGLAGSTEAARRLGVRKVLPKPFTRRELLSAVREAMGGNV